MQCSQVYSLPVVYQDLRQPFVLKDIVQQLDQLDTVVNDVVNRLQFKVSQCPTPEENRQIIWLGRLLGSSVRIIIRGSTAGVG